MPNSINYLNPSEELLKSGNVLARLTEYNKLGPKAIKSFGQFGSSCPPRLRFNAYIGCDYCCQFCYVPGNARPLTREVKKAIIHDIEVLKKLELDDLSVMISCSCDPFQPLEKEKKYARTAMEVLVENGFSLIIMTQAPNFLLKDDYLKIIQNANVGIVVEVTIPSMKAGRHSGVFHTLAPSAEERFEAMQKLVNNGIPVRLRIEPIIPRLDGLGAEQSEEDIKELVHRYAVIAKSAKPDMLEDMTVNTKVMDLSEQVRLYKQYKDFYLNYGIEKVREDEIRMLSIRPDLQEKLLEPVYKACVNEGLRFCPCVSSTSFYGGCSCIPSWHRTSDTFETWHNWETKNKINPTIDFISNDSHLFAALLQKVYCTKRSPVEANDKWISSFEEACEKRRLRDFFSQKAFIKEVIEEVRAEFPGFRVPRTEALNFSMLSPVLYWAMEPVIRFATNLLNKDTKKPKVVWGAVNFWDKDYKAHASTQFLNGDCYPPGNSVVFTKTIREWLLSKDSSEYVLTLLELFLGYHGRAPVVVFRKDSSSERDSVLVHPREIRGECLISLDGYEEIHTKLIRDFPRHKFVREIRSGRAIASLMSEYLSTIDYSPELISRLRRKIELDFSFPYGNEGIKKLLNLFVVFDFVTPQEWKWIVVYPGLMHFEGPIGGVFLVLNSMLDSIESSLMHFMTSQAFLSPSLIMAKHSE